MDRTQFLNGLKIFWSAGGANPDKDTLTVWFEMLKHIHPKDYEKSIVHIMKSEKNLATINFIFEVSERAREFKASRESDEQRNRKQLPQGDMIPHDELKKLVSDYVKSIKTIPKVKGDEDER